VPLVYGYFGVKVDVDSFIVVTDGCSSRIEAAEIEHSGFPTNFNHYHVY
jgi:hypothetical protein